MKQYLSLNKALDIAFAQEKMHLPYELRLRILKVFGDHTKIAMATTKENLQELRYPRSRE